MLVMLFFLLFFCSQGIGSYKKIKGSMSGDVAGMPTDKLISYMQKGQVDELPKLFKKAHDDIDTEIRFEEDMEKMTALHYAAKMGYVQAVEKLLELGADVHKETQFDLNTPLHLACSCRDSEASLRMVVELLHKGVDVGRENYCGRTPLIVASEANHPEVVNILCCQGAFLDQQFGEEEYPPNVSKAIYQADQRCQSLDLDEVGDPYLGNTAFIQACREHHINVIEELIQQGCDINAPNIMGNTPLHVTCLSYCRSAFQPEPTRFPISGNKDIVGLLLQQQCALDMVNAREQTPVTRTISGIPFIDKTTYDGEEKSREIQTLLEIVQILVRAGCSVSPVAANSDSTLTALLRTSKIVCNYKSDILQAKLTKCLRMVLAAGCQVSTNDLHMLKQLQPSSLAAAMMEYIRKHCHTPPTLKQTAKFRIRQLTHKPLSHFLPKTPLPQHIQRYLLLQVED